MDVFAEHGVAGMLGLLFNALFGADYIIGLDGVNSSLENTTTGTLAGGWVSPHNYRQLYIQVAYIVAVTAYAFVMSALIAYAINLIPGLHLRASEEAELLGMDDDQLGEFAYDYVEVRRDYLAWTPSKGEPLDGEHSVPQRDRHGITDHREMLSADGETTEGVEAESESSGANGTGHHGIGGDRHGVAAEEKLQEKNGHH